jgi:hypothetical protein
MSETNRGKKAGSNCQPYRAVRSKFVSTESLLETGIFAGWPGDFREILAEVADFRRLETDAERTKSP